MNFGWGGAYGGMPGGMPRRFEEQYHCYSMAYAEKGHLEGGDKILLPQSALDTLARLQVDYPMLFRLQSSDKGTMTHCGVLEFSAPEGSCYIPYWMMQNLLIEEGSVITITNVSLPKATFVKLQPQHVDFLEISDPRAVLEYALRNFSCVTKGDVIQLPFNNKNYHFELKEVEPQDAACIIETDCNVDFDAPVGYTENHVKPPASGDSGAVEDSLVKTIKNIAKQSAYKKGSSNASSPASGNKNDTNAEDPSSTSSLKVVDGEIIRPDEDEGDSQNKKDESSVPMMAQQTGGTGVQRNAAIAVKAPKIDYWAVSAGDGARLDGKKPSTLKDSKGNEIDIRKLRAEAAARRLEAKNGGSGNVSSMPSAGKMVNGKVFEHIDDSGDDASPAKKASAGRKSRTGSKYSKLKKSGGYAFQGSANTFKK